MKTVGRRQSRRTALFLLYQWDVTGQPLGSLYEGSPDEFAAELAEAVAKRAPHLDERITSASDSLDRRQARYARAERPADRRLRAGGGCGATRGGDQRGCRAGEAVRDRRGREARERDSRADPAGAGRGRSMTASNESLRPRAGAARAPADEARRPGAGGRVGRDRRRGRRPDADRGDREADRGGGAAREAGGGCGRLTSYVTSQPAISASSR